jgi:O-antigen/teichoic acid export membrane protein
MSEPLTNQIWTSATAVARSSVARQTTLFAVSGGIVALMSAISTAILARNLSNSTFGSFSFAMSFLALVGLIFEFGLFLPASRLMAQGDVTARREYAGAALVVFAPIAIALCAAVFVFSSFTDHWFNVHAGEALRITAPLCFVYSFSRIGLQLAQGADKLHIYSVTSALSQALFLGSLVVAAALAEDLGLTLPLALRATASLVAGVVLVAWIRPRFQNWKRNVRELIQQAKVYGLEIYFGRLLGIGTYNLDVLMVAAWTNAREVGLYALAGAMATALGLPVLGFASALFPKMARQGILEKRWLILSALAGLAGLIFLWVAGGQLIDLFFSHRYRGAQEFVVPLAAAQAVRGVTSIYNSFLSAHARGKDLRNAALILTVSNVVLNFALIPSFGALGAAWASLTALTINLGAHIFFYGRIVNGQGSGPNREDA